MFTILMRKIENKKEADKKEERRGRQRDEGKHDNDQKMRQQMKLNNFATVCQVVYVYRRVRSAPEAEAAAKS